MSSTACEVIRSQFRCKEASTLLVRGLVQKQARRIALQSGSQVMREHAVWHS